MSKSAGGGADSPQEEVESLKHAIKKELLKVFYILLVFITTNFIPILLMGTVSFAGFLFPAPLNVTIEPRLGVHLGGEGTPLPQIINIAVVMEMIRNTITLYGKGVPQIITDPTVADTETND
jgi:hypothetical protein